MIWFLVWIITYCWFRCTKSILGWYMILVRANAISSLSKKWQWDDDFGLLKESHLEINKPSLWVWFQCLETSFGGILVTALIAVFWGFQSLCLQYTWFVVRMSATVYLQVCFGFGKISATDVYTSSDVEFWIFSIESFKRFSF